jgi:16S rRNA (cytosine1402-N4)-methyltransferase
MLNETGHRRGIMTERHSSAELSPGDAPPPVEHLPVLQAASIALLAPAPGMAMLDGTFGGGGHTRALLDGSAPDGRVLALDADPDAIARGEPLRAEYGDRLILRHANFAAMAEAAAAVGWEAGTLGAILLDLGLSSFQLGDAARGFSFMHDGPLDMRFDTTGGLTAAEIVNTWDETALADLFWAYGEEPASRRVARQIVQRRTVRPYTTTLQLTETVVGAKGGRRGRIHPATQVFQALRIAVNDEVGALERALAAARDLLRPGGRLAVISFHSLEDRAVKLFFRHEASATEPDMLPRSMPVQPQARAPSLRILTPRPVTPTDAEIAANPRARSAKLRAAEKRAPDGGA